MRIACPSCSAEYQVPDALLASGPRLLRCARCGHQFQAALPAPAAPQEADAPAPRAAPRPPAASAARAESRIAGRCAASSSRKVPTRKAKIPPFQA
ncbi:zinc-ribbon domain-containing protein [Planktothrix agardhii]|uniref:zinc-ribbon domain-containing protein n=1 Tax=Planktothrix agardhii TaxID=1160 RepID=UPI0039AEF603